MPRKSAGILIYRWRDGAPEVFLVHPGGPFWANKDEAAWFPADVARDKLYKGQAPFIDRLLAHLEGGP